MPKKVAVIVPKKPKSKASESKQTDKMAVIVKKPKSRKA